MAHSAALPLVDNLASLGLDTLVAFGTPDEDAAALVNRTASRAEPICTAVPFLDRLGVRVGRGYAIVGPTGTGKTELLIQARFPPYPFTFQLVMPSFPSALLVHAPKMLGFHVGSGLLHSAQEMGERRPRWR